MALLSFREALGQAMAEEMRRDENVFLMGEEVGVYQGAYKVSQGMLQEFGEKRVIDTPITEAAFAGLGIGAAMVGLRPIVEMMTFNFAILALDQIINNAAKIRYMSGGQLKVPLVVRGPGGAAHSLGAQHSQSTEIFYAHCPGLKVVMPSTPADAKGLLKAAIRDDNPVVFIESEVMYGWKGEVPSPQEGDYTIPLGKGEIKREGKDVTIVAYGKMVHAALEASKQLAQEGVSAEVVDPRTLRPLDEELIVSSAAKTGRAVVVEEGWPYGGCGAEVCNRIYHQAFDLLDAPVERVTAEDVPMPYAHNLEQMVIASPAKIVDAAKRTLY